MQTQNQNNIFAYLEGKNEVLSKLKQTGKIEITGIPDSAKTIQILGLVDSADKATQPVFWFVKNDVEIENIYAQINFWQKYLKRDLIVKTKFDSDFLYSALNYHPYIFLISIENLNQNILSPNQFNNSILFINIEQKNCSHDSLIEHLIKYDYQEERKTIIPGTFSRRGNIIDVFSPQNQNPYRIEFLGDKIEKISNFNPKTNKVIKKIDKCKIIPLSIDGRSSFLTYFKHFKNSLIIYEDFEKFSDLALKNDFENAIQKCSKIKIIPFPTNKKQIQLSYQSVPSFSRNFNLLKKEIDKLQNQNWQIYIASQHREELSKLFKNTNNLRFLDSISHLLNDRSKVKISNFYYLCGFKNTKTKLLFLTDFEIFGAKIETRKPKKIDTSAFVAELKIGDYIVHLDHGIGKFIGITKHQVDEGEREFFILEYADHDKLYLPVEYADKITKYVGKPNPPIYRLHGAEWDRVKHRVKEKNKIIAKELLNLYANREISHGFAFSPDTVLQKELENSFEYQETEDQIKVLKEIKADMEGSSIGEEKNDEENEENKKSVIIMRSHNYDQNHKNNKIPNNYQNLVKTPMDRLLCGDVGFGKTEIALRAAFKTAQDNKQTALLCPTTILAQQHFDTFCSRLKNFPVNIAALSRFQSKQKQKEILCKLKNGEIDIIIGTHRLLSQDVRFKDLGLLIIDEEQRFGVKQKEKIKKLKDNVDILTLSATPIPRTLHFALSGLRDISTIETPPPGRLPIETFIMPYDDNKIIEAIKNEVARAGQVYFVHNRVQTIGIVLNKFKKLLPKIKVAAAYGTMPEKKLAATISDFFHKKIDVLICSSIIENGLDMPNVNTLIVDDATRFGLADLYQLRGRIGRGAKNAYAYFFYHSQNLKKRAQIRLEALLAAREIGSGFQLAMRDLEIRGAGNILGREQSGSIEAIGLSLYCRLLSQTIEEIKTGKKLDEDFDVTIDLPISAYIPKEIISSEQKRIELYQKMTNITEISELNKFKEKILYRFYHGRDKNSIKLDKEILNLFKILEIKILAKSAKISSIDSRLITPLGGKKFHRIILKSRQQITPPVAIKLLKENTNFQISDFEIKIKLEDLGKNWLEKIKEILQILA